MAVNFKKDDEKILNSEFLDEIKRVREEKGISQEEISERTNIRLSYIKAIESGDIDGLPGGIYNKAYIRSVSEFLGLSTKSFERNAISSDYADDQRIKLEVGSKGFVSHVPNFVILAVCFALILLVYGTFYLIGGNNDIVLEDHLDDGQKAVLVKKSPLKSSVEDIVSDKKDFMVSIIATEQTQVEITDKNDNVILSKIFLPNEAIIYPADDGEYYLYTPEIGVLEVYLDGVFVSGLVDVEKQGDKFPFKVDTLFDAVEPKFQDQVDSVDDSEKTDV